MTSPTLAQFLQIAIRQRGYTEEPPGSNRTKFASKLDEVYGPVILSSGSPFFRNTGGSGSAWCAVYLFDCWCAAAEYPSDPGLPIKGFNTVDDFRAWAAAGLWHPGTDGIQIGDWCYYKWPNVSHDICDHVEVVTHVMPDGSVMTLGGNTSPQGLNANGGGVFHFTGLPSQPVRRPKSTIIGYGRPPYAQGPQPEVYPGQILFDAAGRLDSDQVAINGGAGVVRYGFQTGPSWKIPPVCVWTDTGRHVWYNRRTLPRDAQKGRPSEAVSPIPKSASPSPAPISTISPRI